MRGVRWVGTALACLVLVACGAASAGAAPLQKVPAKPITLATAQYDTEPDVAVDAGGVGHIAWTDGVPGQPNVLKYCRLPRGATTCQRTESWNIPAEQFSRVRVLLGRAAGQVVILAERCCAVSAPPFPSDEVLWATVSGDGGQSFAAPRAIGSGDPSGDAIFGPGDFGVTTITAVVTNGTIVQNAPLDGLTGAKANLTGGVADKAFYGSLALINPTTPMAAYSDLNTGTYWRVWSGAGDLNDAGSWGPEGKIPGLDEPRITGGPKGVWMKGMTLGPFPRFLTARRYDPTNNTWGAPVTLSNKTDSPVFSDISQDAGGHVAVVWRSSRENDTTVQYRATSDGKTWTAARPLVRGDDVVNPQIGTGPDGGGFVVWDHNNQGPVRAAVIPPLGKGSGSGSGGTTLPCEDQVTFNGGKVVVAASDGCLQKRKDGSYETHDAVRVNGIDVLPVGGARRSVGGGPTAHTAATATITVDPDARTIAASGSVETRAGTVLLDRGSFSWKVPNGSKVDIGTFSDLGKFKISLLGFPIVGTAELYLTPQGAVIPVNLKLPPIFGSVTGQADLLLTAQDGLKLKGLKIDVADAMLGAFEIHQLSITYQSDPAVFEGSASFRLPPTYSERDEARMSFGFENGKFKHAGIERFPFNPALQIYPPFLSLTAIGFTLSLDPLIINGGVELAAGPVIGGTSAISIDALPPNGFTFAFTDPALLKVSGDVKVVNQTLGGGFISYRTDGLLQFGGGIDWDLDPIIHVTAGVATKAPDGPAFIDLSSGRFSAVIAGSVDVLDGLFTAEGKGAISSRGFAVCGSVGLLVGSINVGAGYVWGGDFDLFAGAGGCDVSDYTEQARRRGASPRAATTGEVTLPAGLPQANIALTGEGGAARVRLVGPDGQEIIASPAGSAKGTKTDRAVLMTEPKSGQTLIIVASPAAGTYRVEALPGSPAFSAPKVADGLPEPKVTATVGGHGHARTLRYTVKAIPGQKVSFAERGDGAGAMIAAAKGTRGTLRFAPADGAAGKRSIVAIVEQNGLPRRELVVASYVAPANRRAGRPGRVRVTRKGSGLKVTWRKAARATSYVATIVLKDGRRQARIVPARTRSVTFARVSNNVGGKVTVAGRRLGPRPGPSATATVKAVKKKKRRR